jgi:hypothetical protein
MTWISCSAIFVISHTSRRAVGRSWPVVILVSSLAIWTTAAINAAFGLSSGPRCLSRPRGLVISPGAPPLLTYQTGHGLGTYDFPFIVVRILVARPDTEYLILHGLLSFSGAFFRAYLRGLVVPRSKAVCGRDGLTRDFGRGRHENLSGAISWLTFFAGGAADAR